MTFMLSRTAPVLLALAMPVWSMLAAGDAPPSTTANWTHGLVNADILKPITIGEAKTEPYAQGLHVTNDPLIPQPSLVQDGPLKPISIIVPRGGFGSGQVVMQGMVSQAKLTATMSALAGAGGGIPATKIQVRYAAAKPVMQMRGMNIQDKKTEQPYYTDLVSTPPDAPVVPIWVTVEIPPETKPGTYKGTLTVKPVGEAKATAVAVEVEVAPWLCPPPRQWTAHLGLVSIPDSTAYYYKVKHFSDEHFKLMGKSFELMAGLGCDMLWIPCMADRQTGSSVSMVRCKSATGKPEADLSLVEKYVDLYLKTNAPPEVCYIYVQNGDSIGNAYPWDTWPEERQRKTPPNPAHITLSDGVGDRQFVYGTPEAEDFYKQVMDGMYAIFKKRGLDTDSLMLGTSSEKRPRKDVVAFFQKIGPKWRWVSQEHDTPKDLDGVAVGYNCPARTNPYGNTNLGKGYYGWQCPVISGATAQQPTGYGHPAYWRERCEYWMDTKGTRGLSRMGMDLWIVNDGKETFQPEHWSGGQGVMRMAHGLTCHLAPGPDGAIATTHYEWTREGLQELEARIEIEKAMVAKSLSPEQEAAAKKFLHHRTDAYFAGGVGIDLINFQCWNWQDLTRQLYQMATTLPPAKK